jgi:hypothetical protein
MSVNFPISIDSLSNPASGDALNNVTTPHATQHANLNDAVEALETKVGANSSAVTTSHDYKLSEVTTTDKAVGKTATQTLTNKTLTSPQINMGTNATGDMYYRDGAGAFQRLPIGSAGQILDVSSGGIPEWIANPSAADASYTVKGVVKGLTDEATSGLTISSGVISVNSGTTANKILKLDASAKIPAVDGSQLTNLSNPAIFKNGVTTYDMSTASGTQNIAHGLGKTPKKIKLTLFLTNAIYAFHTYNGTTNSGLYYNATQGLGAGTTNYLYTGANTGVQFTTTFDGTNISIAYTKEGSPTGTLQIMWEAEA